MAPMVAETAYPLPFIFYLIAVLISVGAASMLTEIGEEEKESDISEFEKAQNALTNGEKRESLIENKPTTIQ